ncbi:MAG: Crp/Fnr family transcriptional regulator [Eudoraea sp.]|nr:Crp/Fnr family transcriptional regulator [Eudoraea sp.]NNE28730.1 Crp/Fnr family transcriptional regulator [Saprospiraceae bacterium]
MSPRERAFTSLQRHFEFLTINDIEDIIEISRIETFKKRQKIHTPGHRLTDFYFLISGFVRGFILDKNDVERSVSFRDTGDFFGDPRSIAFGQPSNLNFEVIEDAEVLIFPIPKSQLVSADNLRIARLYRVGLEKAVWAYMEHNQILLANKPQERYEILMKLRPMIFQRVSNKHIATYLGITPNSLSRIMKRNLEAKKESPPEVTS